MSDEETLKVYAERAQDYTKLIVSTGADPMVARFVSGVPQDGTVLDIGCGPGQAAAAFAAAGLTAHAWDPVPEMLALAEANPGVVARQAGYDDLVEVDAFDGVWANFSMLHTPLVRWPDQFAAIHRALKPGGLLHFGTKLGTGEARDSIGRKYSYMTEEALTNLLGQTGFTIEYSRTGEEAGLSGEVAPFIVLQARA